MVLSSRGCKVPWALRGGCGLCGGLRGLGCGCCDSLRRRHDAFLHHIPGAGSLDSRLPCAGKPHRGLPAASLGSAASIVRARGLREKCVLTRFPFFKNHETGACNFSRNRLYCVQGKKKSDCFPPVAAGDLEAVVFLLHTGNSIRVLLHPRKQLVLRNQQT